MADQYVTRKFPTGRRGKLRPKRPPVGLPFFSRDPRQMWLPMDLPAQKEGRLREMAEAAKGEENPPKNTLAAFRDQGREGR